MTTSRRLRCLECLVTFAIAAYAVIFVSGGMASADTSDSTTYGSGNYGNCDFGSCTLTLTSGSVTNVNVIPSPSGSCSVQGNTVSVQTDSSTGYTLTMTTSTPTTAMTGAGSSINAASGTAAAPALLAMNTWGYRVDGSSGFGSGPTIAQSSSGIPSVTFAGVPASNQTATTLASSSTQVVSPVNTMVWYGVCANTSIISGAYSVAVTYTAVTN